MAMIRKQETPLGCRQASGSERGGSRERDSVPLARFGEACRKQERPVEAPTTEHREGDGVPNGIRTRVLALKGPRPRPLDDGDARVPQKHEIITRRRHGC